MNAHEEYVATHNRPLLDALVIARKAASDADDADNVAYWQHEINALIDALKVKTSVARTVTVANVPQKLAATFTGYTFATPADANDFGQLMGMRIFGPGPFDRGEIAVHCIDPAATTGPVTFAPPPVVLQSNSPLNAEEATRLREAWKDAMASDAASVGPRPFTPETPFRHPGSKS